MELVLNTQPHTIDGRQVECKNAIPKDMMTSSNTAQDDNYSKFNMRKIFVGGLPPNIREEELKAYFDQFGEVVQCLLMIDKPTKKSRG